MPQTEDDASILLCDFAGLFDLSFQYGWNNWVRATFLTDTWDLFINFSIYSPLMNVIFSMENNSPVYIESGWNKWAEMKGGCENSSQLIHSGQHFNFNLNSRRQTSKTIKVVNYLFGKTPQSIFASVISTIVRIRRCTYCA